jgi:hypothetical protein
MTDRPKTGWRRFPELAYNPITFLGVLLALFGLSAIIILTVLSLQATGENPYLGIFTLVVFPGVMVLGLLLIPIGMLFEKRRQERGQIRPFVIDLRNPQHRNAALLFSVGTAIFLLMTTVGLFETYHFTESVAFCGETCHVMHPEKTTHQLTAHSEVACVHCHVGPGTGGYVESKLAGARQLWHFLKGDYHRPIPVPVHNLPLADETCGHCHDTERRMPPVVRVYDHYLSDETNRRWQVRMLFDVGGAEGPDGASGVHWHLAPENAVSYIAGDSARGTIERVEWANGGEPVVYTKGGRPQDESWLAAARAEHRERTMDCFDCHNRPAHRYPTPMEAVNAALASGELDASIPFVKRTAVRALTGNHDTREAAHAAIADTVAAAFREVGRPEPAGLVAALTAVYDRSNFPEMKARWDVYPEHDGHLVSDGCFRCHGSDLATPEGRTIRADCNLCHQVYAQGYTDQPADTALGQPFFHPFVHPIDVQGSDKTLFCTDCHNGDASLYTAQAKAPGAAGRPAAR